MWIFSIPSPCQLSLLLLFLLLLIGSGSGRRPICDMRADDGPEGGAVPTSPFVRHFHFVWVLSGPLTIALVFLAAAAVARVVTCVPSIIVSSVLCLANNSQSISSFCILALRSAMTCPVECPTRWTHPQLPKSELPSHLGRILRLVSGAATQCAIRKIRTRDTCARRFMVPFIEGGPAVIYRCR